MTLCLQSKNEISALKIIRFFDDMPEDVKDFIKTTTVDMQRMKIINSFDDIFMLDKIHSRAVLLSMEDKYKKAYAIGIDSVGMLKDFFDFIQYEIENLRY